MNAPHNPEDPSTVWDLSTLYASPDDEARASDRRAIMEGVESFADSYRGKVATLDGAGVATMLTALAELRRVTRRYIQFTSLRVSVASQDAQRRADQAEAEGVVSTVNQTLAFLGVEVSQLGPAHFEAIADKDAFATYGYWLDQELKFAPFTLSEEAERTIARKNVTAKQSWVNLYMETSAALSFPLEIDGEVHNLTRSEVSSKRSDADRGMRRAAMKSLTDTHKSVAHVLNFCFNTIFEDHRSDTKERGYPDVLHFTVLQDGLTPEIVRSLIDTVTSSFPKVSHRWHSLRAKVLGLDDYSFEDTYMPAFGDEPESPWPEARGLVVDAFTRFAPEAGEWAQHALDNGWVDVFPRAGKRSGAFCSSASKPDHAFVMLNHAGKLDDTFTLAHEFGHAWHFTLAQRAQDSLTMHTGTPLAETASVFAELWLHEMLMEGADPQLRKQLLARQIDDAMGTAFRQITYVNWELRAHERRAAGVASPEDFGALWLEELARFLGPDVALDAERDSWWWIQIPHFIFARFYCYSYAFGKMLTLALYDLWKERGDAFVEEYHALLAAGGSRSPADLFGDLGLDLADPAFWQRGVDVLVGYLDELEELLDAE
ncbi:MAG: M3 family oligoendopeptidase [Deltaproteobacteria bacterium]|nr:M3 family oligoendopeptidase [Deltaproteobacteria bacterium]